MPGSGRLLLALVALTSAVAGNVLPGEDCGQGEKHWCQNLLTAMRCGAVEHCLRSVWNPQQLEADTLCDNCKLIVTTAGAMVKDGSLQDYIKKVMHSECAKLPMHQLVLPCQLGVDKYLTSTVDMLLSFLKPDAICSRVGLCHTNQSGNTVEELLTNQVWEKVLPIWKKDFYRPDEQTRTQGGSDADFPIPLPLCWMCRSFIGRLEAAIPKDAIVKSAAKICLLLPLQIAGVCQCVVEKYAIILLDLILGKLGPQLVCGLVLMCATDENCSPVMPMIPVLGKDLGCETCVAVTTLVKQSFNENNTRLEMEEALIKACDRHHVDWHECQMFIQSHQLELFAVLTKQWDPMTTCQEIGACVVKRQISEGSEGCNLGPAYWCLSMANAIKCKEVTYCKTQVWS
ncbi:pulmonary surfactant-associated protein B [Ambystoma mexicanum]|uniref:pulmonary surfactant-associated protein B n=1 Tax=Ambystoma mexicanum TaxID=8296 RepID=UPI0037E80ADD